MGLRDNDRLQDALGALRFFSGKVLLILIGIYIGWELFT